MLSQLQFAADGSLAGRLSYGAPAPADSNGRREIDRPCVDRERRLATGPHLLAGDDNAQGDRRMTSLGKLIRRSVDVREGELPALLWSSAYFLLILTAYYILRPIRDEMGRIGGTRNLAWLFTATMIGMLLIHPVFTSLVTRFPRRVFIPYIYRFFILNL